MTRDANNHTAAQNIKHLLHTRWNFRKADVRAKTLADGRAEIVDFAPQWSETTERCLSASGLIVERIDDVTLRVNA